MAIKNFLDKERQKFWEKAKKEKRDAEKRYYQYAPFLVRIWNLYVKRVVYVVAMLFIILLLVYCAKVHIKQYALNQDTVNQDIIDEEEAIRSYELRQELKKKPLTEDQKVKVYEESPIDSEGAARVKALPKFGKDETWTICLYMVGSDLEDDGNNYLSELTKYETNKIAEKNKADLKEKYYNNLKRYMNELHDSGLELPKFFYYPNIPVESKAKSGIKIEVDGAGTTDIDEITSGEWSDNIKFVIQTGGAKKWDNQMINPNRTQRFLYNKGSFKEVSNMALQDSSNPDTLSDFLEFCKNEYPSDHRILILWNHGSGPFGYGKDTIYGKRMTLKGIRSALQKVYNPNFDSPAFDIIGFDACLMSTIEVTNALSGFADYYCLSEEAIPGDGWDYAPWLKAMTDDPTMSAAEVGMAITDSFTDYYIGNNVKDIGYNNSVTFSLIDARKADELYNAYNEFVKIELLDSINDISVLADMSRAAYKSTAYGYNYHNIFNTIDLGNYIDNLMGKYPNECKKIKDLIRETVLYHRENGLFKDSKGIAVYFPDQVETLSGINYFIDYVYNISESDMTKILYYYIQAGCITNEMKETLKSITDKVPKTLDVSLFNKFSSTEPTFDNATFFLPISNELRNQVVDYQLLFGKVDKKNNKLISYGYDNVLSIDENGINANSFDGKWIHINNIPLYVELVNTSDSVILYKAHVMYNDKEAYLMISRDLETGDVDISGISEVSDTPESRLVVEIQANAKISPIYISTDLDSGAVYSDDGEEIIYSDNTKLSLKSLEDGDYISSAVITDQRGDYYYSNIVGLTMSNGKASDWRVETEYYPQEY